MCLTWFRVSGAGAGEKRGKIKLKWRDCVLFFKVMYFCICRLVCVGGQVWTLVCLLVQCQREVEVGVVPGPAHILHPHKPTSSCTHQSGKTLRAWHRWSRCVSPWWHQMAVTLPWGNHLCLAHVLCASGLPPEINSSLWCTPALRPPITILFSRRCFGVEQMERRMRRVILQNVADLHVTLPAKCHAF